MMSKVGKVGTFGVMFKHRVKIKNWDRLKSTSLCVYLYLGRERLPRATACRLFPETQPRYYCEDPRKHAERGATFQHQADRACSTRHPERYLDFMHETRIEAESKRWPSSTYDIDRGCFRSCQSDHMPGRNFCSVLQSSHRALDLMLHFPGLTLTFETTQEKRDQRLLLRDS